jgi:hypothetical protein
MEKKIRRRLKAIGFSDFEIEMEIREYRWQKNNPLKGGE